MRAESYSTSFPVQPAFIRHTRRNRPAAAAPSRTKTTFSIKQKWAALLYTKRCKKILSEG
jgi:hypothetical protein